MTLVTTLLSPEVYAVADLAELYRQRGQVETALAQLKTTMPMDVRHGQTVPGVRQELTGFAIVYHLVRRVMWPSATRQYTAVERNRDRNSAILVRLLRTPLLSRDPRPRP
jgi:hypothetical protein